MTVRHVFKRPAFKGRMLALALLGTGAAAGLSGCITLLPEVKPVQLYTIRFNPLLIDKAELTAPSASPDARPVDVFVNFEGFPRAASGDRILTTEGNEVAYVAGGRWASPAQSQFRDLLSEGFARQAGSKVRIGNQGRISGDYRLDVTVRRFEAAYVRRKPSVVVEVDARLVRVADRQVIADRFISSNIGVRKNDLTQMVAGFEQASSQVTVELLAFTEEGVALAETAKTASK